MLSVTDATFEQEVLNYEGFVMVDFWAEWCGPCIAIMPLVEKIAENYKDRLKVVKVNVDANAKYVTQFNIRGIPTLLVFKNGELVATLAAFINETSLTAQIEKILG